MHDGRGLRQLDSEASVAARAVHALVAGLRMLQLGNQAPLDQVDMPPEMMFGTGTGTGGGGGGGSAGAGARP